MPLSTTTCAKFLSPRWLENMPVFALPADLKLKFHKVSHLTFSEDAQLIDLAYSPDGSLLAIAFKSLAYLYHHVQSSDTDHEESWRLKAMYTLRKATAQITCMTWTAVSLLVFGFDNGDVSVMKASSEENILVGFQVSDQPINCIEMDRKGRLVAISAGDAEVGFWGIISGPEARWVPYNYLPELDNTLQLPVKIRGVRWCETDDLPTLAVAYQHQGIAKWKMDFESGQGTIAGNIVRTQSPIVSGCFSPNGDLFLVSNGRNGFSVFDLRSGVSADEFIDDQFASSPSLDFFNNTAKFMFGSQWLVGSSRAVLNLWEVKSRVLAQTIALDERFRHHDIGKIAASGVRRDNLIENLRIAASLSKTSRKTEVVIYKAFLRDELVNAPILVEAAPGAHDQGMDTSFWMSVAAVLVVVIGIGSAAFEML